MFVKRVLNLKHALLTMALLTWYLHLVKAEEESILIGATVPIDQIHPDLNPSPEESVFLVGSFKSYTSSQGPDADGGGNSSTNPVSIRVNL